MKTYQEIRDKHLTELGKPSSGGFFIFGVVLVFASLVIIASLWNTASMQSVSVENSKDYVTELTIQTAGTIATDVSDKKANLTSIAESLRLHFDDGLEETTTTEYLRAHLESFFKQSQFEYIVFHFMDAEPIEIGTLPEGLSAALNKDYPAVAEAHQKGECIAYVDNGNIIYAVSVYSQDRVIGSLVAGVNDSSLNELMLSHVYQDESSFCIANRKGNLLVASGDDHFAETAEILSPDNPDNQELVQSLEADFLSGDTGVTEVKLSDGQNYLLTYAPVEGEDWMMVTLIPTNVFSKAYLSYMQRALAFTIGAALMFVLLLGLLVKSYKGARKRLEYLAYTDELTAGINSVDFQMRYSVLQRKANPCEYSIVFLDINDFKLINEMGGFAAGDRLIKYVYDTITQTLDARDNEFACRVEIDHFFICMHENTQEGIQARLDKIEKLINEAGEDITLGFHIRFAEGAAIIDSADTSIDELTQRARIARRATAPGERNRCSVYNEDMRHEISQRIQLDYMAEESLKNGDFVVYFQPKVSMASGKVVGAEALVRWNHPNRGFISPADFVPALEDSGRIQDVDKFVYEETCRYLSERKGRGEPLFTISVNLSRIHFWKDGFVSELASIADVYEIDHRYIEFEITETVFMEQDKLCRIKDGIRAMHEAGFTCALDDFGSGYSSLTFVNEMDIDTLKFDRSFFLNLEDEKSRKVVESLIRMGNNLAMDMVIEGIETQEQIDFVRAAGADVIQGYYYSKPLAEADFEAWVASRV